MKFIGNFGAAFTILLAVVLIIGGVVLIVHVAATVSFWWLLAPIPYLSAVYAALETLASEDERENP